jgi:hypothetical protein
MVTTTTPHGHSADKGDSVKHSDLNTSDEYAYATHSNQVASKVRITNLDVPIMTLSRQGPIRGIEVEFLTDLLRGQRRNVETRQIRSTWADEVERLRLKREKREREYEEEIARAVAQEQVLDNIREMFVLNHAKPPTFHPLHNSDRRVIIDAQELEKRLLLAVKNAYQAGVNTNSAAIAILAEHKLDGPDNYAHQQAVREGIIKCSWCE